jgi:hypothetical protein
LHGGLRDGIDVIEVHNGAFLFIVVPSRGMGLWRGDYRGLPLGWRAPLMGPVHPRHIELGANSGLGWLHGFDEWLCRCGLAWNGPPGEDVWLDSDGQERRQPLTLHGRIANLPAHYVEVRLNLDPPHEISVIGQVLEASLYAGALCLTTTYTTVPGSNRLVIHDVVENRSGESSEMQLLYHFNVGPPFLEGGSRVIAPIKEMSPLNAASRAGVETHDTYAPPTPGFAAQVFCHELLGDSTGRTTAMLYNAAADRGLALRFRLSELPCFTVWRNTVAMEDGYVTGLEPATNFPNLRSFERQQGRVRVLPPGGRWEASWSLEVLDTAAQVARILGEIVTLQSQVRPTIHREPHPRFSAEAPA